jgi:hypothetical protein
VAERDGVLQRSQQDTRAALLARCAPAAAGPTIDALLAEEKRAVCPLSFSLCTSLLISHHHRPRRSERPMSDAVHSPPLPTPTTLPSPSAS